MSNCRLLVWQGHPLGGVRPMLSSCIGIRVSCYLFNHIISIYQVKNKSNVGLLRAEYNDWPVSPDIVEP